ncbi:CD276 antigen homolog [Acanthopagrus schlegelii]
MELLPLVCLCLLSCSGDAVRVVVEEGSDAVLPCLLSTKEDISYQVFDWKKDGQKEVFKYDAGIHYNNGRQGQDEQFKGRVSHFQDQLQNGNASIKITRTKMADSGTYSCDFPRPQPRQTSIIELVVARVRVVVEEDSDAVLPCLISTKEDISGKLFDWKKDGQKQKVFLYDGGVHSQDDQFKGRVSFFKDQLQNGNASIKINKTKMADSGNYSCDFPRHQPGQTFIIELVVGAAPEPCIRTLAESNLWSLLQCEAHGDPLPTIKWEDSENKTLPAEEPKISDRGGRFYITVNINVTKTDNYSCVATQEKFSHQVAVVTSVHIGVPPPEPGSSAGLFIGGVVCGLFVAAVAAVAAVVYHFKDRIKRICAFCSTPDTANGPPAADSSLPMIENNSGTIVFSNDAE